MLNIVSKIITYDSLKNFMRILRWAASKVGQPKPTQANWVEPKPAKTSTGYHVLSPDGQSITKILW